jgi:hypothetical protein
VFQFNFEGVHMLKEGHDESFALLRALPFVKLMTLLPLDKTRSIQNRQFSETDGSGRGIGTDR